MGHPIINLPCWCIPFYTSHLWWFPGWFIGFTTWTCEKYMIFVRVLKVNEPTFWMLPHAKSASTSHQCCPRAQATFAWQTWQPGVMTHLSSTAAWRWDNDSHNTETKHKSVVIVSSEHLFFFDTSYIDYSNKYLFQQAGRLLKHCFLRSWDGVRRPTIINFGAEFDMNCCKENLFGKHIKICPTLSWIFCL